MIDDRKAHVQCLIGRRPTGKCPIGKCPTGKCVTGKCPTGKRFTISNLSRRSHDPLTTISQWSQTISNVCLQVASGPGGLGSGGLGGGVWPSCTLINLPWVVMSWYCRKFCDVIIHITPCSAKVLASQLHPDGPGQKLPIFPSVICQEEPNGTPHLAPASTACHPQGGVVVVIYNKI